MKWRVLKTMTKGDIIRKMTDEELARIIAKATFRHLKRIPDEEEIKKEEQYWLEWLKQKQ